MLVSGDFHLFVDMILVVTILNLIFLLYKATNYGGKKIIGRPQIRVRDIIEDESDEETKRYVMEEISVPSTPRRVKTRKELKTFFKSVLSAMQFQKRMERKNKREKKVDDKFNFEFPFDAKKVFDKFDSLDFDIFELKDKPLLYVGMYYLVTHGLMDRFKVPARKMKKFLLRAEEMYKNNPYHNSLHAADTLQTCHAFMCSSSRFKVLSQLDKLVIFFGTCTHDLEHPGYSNRFLVISDHEYALEHNDQSPLENHHCRSLFNLIKECEIRVHFTRSEFRHVRDLCISMILGTDGAKFFHYGKMIRQLVFEQESGVADPKGLVILLMKCSDISNPIKRPKLYLEWTRRVMTEFFSQGDEEEKKNFNISAFMNRNTTSIAKCQMGFIKYLVQPVFKLLAEYDPLFSKILEDLQSKHDFWVRCHSDEEKVGRKFQLEGITSLKDELEKYVEGSFDHSST